MRTLLLALLLGSAALSCDRADTPAPATSQPTTQPEEDTTAQELRPFLLAPTTFPANAESRTPNALPQFLTVAGHEIPIPPPKLTLSSDGTATLIADASTPGTNTFALTFTPISDRAASPWQHATYTFRLTSPDSETPDGLYLGSPDHHLRPLELDIDLIRDPLTPTQIDVTIRGTLIPADSENVSSAQKFELQARLKIVQ